MEIINVLVFLTEYVRRNRNQTRVTSSIVILEREKGKVCGEEASVLVLVFFVKWKEEFGVGMR